MKKTDLSDVLKLVKDKLTRDPEAACGVLYTDLPDLSTRYAVGEEDANYATRIGVASDEE